MQTSAEHKGQGPRSVRCFVLTVSDTRTADNDTSGKAIASLITAAGHEVAGTAIVKDDAPQVRLTIERQIASPLVDVVISTGGTGISARDTTFEAVDSLLEKRL